MFLAHFGVALAAKRIEPRASLAVYALAGLLGAGLLMPWAGWIDAHREPR